jgi:hypothetical protein
MASAEHHRGSAVRGIARARLAATLPGRVLHFEGADGAAGETEGLTRPLTPSSKCSPDARSDIGQRPRSMFSARGEVPTSSRMTEGCSFMPAAQGIRRLARAPRALRSEPARIAPCARADVEEARGLRGNQVRHMHRRQRQQSPRAIGPSRAHRARSLREHAREPSPHLNQV